MKDLQLFKYNQSTRSEITSALQHLNQAMPSFAAMLDRFNELGVAYEDGDGAVVAQLMDEAASRLRKASELMESAPRELSGR